MSVEYLDYHVLGEDVPRRIAVGVTPDERYERVISEDDAYRLGYDGWRLLCAQYRECSYDTESQSYRLTK